MNALKTLQISITDEEGARFNGHELHRLLLKRGLPSQNLVWRKTGDDELTQMLATPLRQIIQEKIGKLEYSLSLQSLLYPFAFEILSKPVFRSADVVHYHLLHTGYFSLSALPILTQSKPSVWTLHDPWAMTGHCVHPFDCEKWKTGCGECPSLDTLFRLKRDNTHFLWKTKEFLYSASNIDIVLASKWMLNMAEASPLMAKFRLHHIPFGIDLGNFKPGNSNTRKAELGIPEENLVIALRSNNNDFKGLDYLLEAFDKLQTDVPITILAFNQKGHFDRFLGRYHIVEPGWITDTELFVRTLQTCDMFLMPSTAESFGMMAVEAMACEKPVLVFEGTALPGVIHAPQGGVAVKKDTDCLVAAMKKLIENSAQRLSIGRKAREIVEQDYDIELHVDRMIDLYSEVQRRRVNSLGTRSASVTSI